MNKIYQELEILTITYKSDHIIEKCLSNIDNKFKITVVENSNNTDFKKKIEQRKNTRCLLTNYNLGFGAAFNIGAKKINSKYILHLNPDVFINDEIIFKLYEMAETKKNLGILSAVESDNETKISNHNNNIEEVNYVRGFLMFINNNNCKITNYFDEKFFLYLEEIDLCIRIRKLKFIICKTPDILIHHMGGKSHNPEYSNKIELQRNWHYMWSLFYFNKKHYGYLYAYQKTIMKFFSALVKMGLFYFFNKKKYEIYKHRFLGLYNSFKNNKSSFRILKN